MRVLAIDPDCDVMGAAVAELPARRLVAVHLVKAPPPRAPARCRLCQPGRRCRHAAADVAGAILFIEATLQELAPRAGDALVTEGQFIPERRRFNPAPLLAFLAGALASRAAARGARVYRVPPASWRGTDPKPVIQAQILASLDPAELALLPRGPRSGRYQGDAVDAVGLALWAVGRAGELRADPSSFAGHVEPARPGPAPGAGGGCGAKE